MGMMAFPPDPVDVVIPPPEPPQGRTQAKPLPVYKTHSERIRTWAAVLSCIASIINMTVALLILFVHYHIGL
jgi:hypothetical protein